MRVGHDAGLGHEHRRLALLDRFTGHHAFADVIARRQLELDVEQGVLDDRAQSAGAGLADQRLVGDRLERVLGEDQLDPVELEEALELADQGVLGFGQDADQVGLVELMERRDDRQAADELGDQAVLDQILRQHLLEELAGILVSVVADHGAEADALVVDPPLDHLLQLGEGAAADEEDVGRVDGQEFLVRVLAAALRRHRGSGAFEDLQQGLLDALAGNVPGQRRIVRLAGDLVDLVDVDDPGLGLGDVVVGSLDQLEQDVLDVLTDVAGFGQRGGVGDRERHVEDSGQGLGEQGLAAAGRAEQHDVRLLEFDVAVALLGHADPLVVVVDSDREGTLGGFLADHVLVEYGVDLLRTWQAVEV